VVTFSTATYTAGARNDLDLATQPYDAILLDLRMPGMNGVEFIQALRRRQIHQHTPIVVASSEGESSELLQEARRLGVAAIVRKPWKPLELAQLVQHAITNSRHQPP
jgi:two-component system, response regulator, stage 0 sporulation protein F